MGLWSGFRTYGLWFRSRDRAGGSCSLIISWMLNFSAISASTIVITVCRARAGRKLRRIEEGSLPTKQNKTKKYLNTFNVAGPIRMAGP